MNKGSVILVPFPFTNLSGSKLRPALVLAVTPLDVTVAFITTQLHWQDDTDVVLTPEIEDWVKKTSLIRLIKLATIDKKLAVGSIGFLSAASLLLVNENLKKIFQLT